MSAVCHSHVGHRDTNEQGIPTDGSPRLRACVADLLKRLASPAVAVLLAAVSAAFAANPALGAEGPKSGTLVIVGGAMKDPAILRKFFELAGGANSPIVIIPTAGGDAAYDQTWDGLKQFRDEGATHLTVVHTTDRVVADSEAFVQPIREARGVFFTGGRQWHLADSYLNTRTHRELMALLGRGGVIGGSSAGASIIGSYLVRGDTKGSETMMGDHEVGLGFLRDVGIDQHVLKRNRQFDLIPLIEAHPELLGIGIDEDTAIVVQGDEFEVIGQSEVLIFDNERQIPPDGKFYFLSHGDHYNVRTRHATRPSDKEGTAFDHVKPMKWGK